MEQAQEPQPANSIFHEKDRVILSIAVAPGVNLMFSLSDDDLEQLYQQRQMRKQQTSRSLEIARLH